MSTKRAPKSVLWIGEIRISEFPLYTIVVTGNLGGLYIILYMICDVKQVVSAIISKHNYTAQIWPVPMKFKNILQCMLKDCALCSLL